MRIARRFGDFANNLTGCLGSQETYSASNVVCQILFLAKLAAAARSAKIANFAKKLNVLVLSVDTFQGCKLTNLKNFTMNESYRTKFPGIYTLNVRTRRVLTAAIAAVLVAATAA